MCGVAQSNDVHARTPELQYLSCPKDVYARQKHHTVPTFPLLKKPEGNTVSTDTLLSQRVSLIARRKNMITDRQAKF